MPKRVTKGNLWGFILSRPYASVSDIRRLFTMDVDDASSLRTSEGTYFVGLPQEAADMIGQLWFEGRIVLDTNPDVKALVVQGVYPARAALGRRGGHGGQADRGPQRNQGSQGNRGNQAPRGGRGPQIAQPATQHAGGGSVAAAVEAGVEAGVEAASDDGDAASRPASGGKRRRRRRRSPNSVAGAEGA